MNQPHLDDETLSALLDGEAASNGHFASCAQCQTRSDALASARAAFADIPPLDEITRARLVRTALEASAPGEGPATIPSRRRWIPAVAAISSAAAVIALAVSLAGPGTSGNRTAAAARAAGSLGDVTDPAALRIALQQTHSSPKALAGGFSDRTAAEAPAGGSATGGSATGGSATGGPGAISDAENQTGRVTPLDVAPQAANRPSAADGVAPDRESAPGPLDSDAASRCADRLQRVHHPGRYRRWATATYRDAAVLVVEFERTERSKIRHKAFVVRPGSCEVVTFASY